MSHIDIVIPSSSVVASRLAACGVFKGGCCVVSVACVVSQIDFLIPSSSVVAPRVAACVVFK